MPRVLRETGVRIFTNTTGATLLSGDLVQLADGIVGIVEGMAGVRNNAVGQCRTDATIVCDKLTGTVIALNDRIEYTPSTKMCIAQLGAAVSPAIIIGRATEAAGSGLLEVTVQLNQAALPTNIPIVSSSSPLTGVTVTANASGLDESINLTPAGTIAALTVTFPTDANSRIGQFIEVFSSQIITALTLTVPAGTLNGATLTAAAANVSYLFRKTATSNVWLRLR